MEYIKLIFLSMVPMIELRGGIPLGIRMDLNLVYLYLICVLIVSLFRQVIDYLRYRKYFNIAIRWVNKKIDGRSKKLKVANIIGFIIFVSEPLPTPGS